MKITAATITNEQIRELRDAAYRAGDNGTVGLCHAALGHYDPLHALTFRSRDTARARCAEILDARAKGQHTIEIETEVRGKPVSNQELHLYHRWSCSCGDVGPWGHSLWAMNSFASAEESAGRHVLNARQGGAK